VSNSAYFSVRYAPCFVAECSTDYEGSKDSSEWSEEEIAAIRCVLQKLTSIRIMNCNDAEDLVQDTLLTMISKYPKSDLEKGPLVWSMGILRNKVGNYYRKTQRHVLLNEMMDGHRSVVETTPAASPERTVFHKELQDIVQESLAQFPSAQRKAMELLIAGFDTGEIVKQLHPESYQNVINRLYRGRRRLAKELAKYGYGPGTKNSAGTMGTMGIMQTMKRCRGKKRRQPLITDQPER
jgi:RNA polymerase sigma factor (sigma-70 family)